MVFAWRRKGFGQHKSKRQCIAFENRVQDIATALSRYPTEVVLNLNRLFGIDQKVRVYSICQARDRLQHTQLTPSFTGIDVGEENIQAQNDSPLVATHENPCNDAVPNDEPEREEVTLPSLPNLEQEDTEKEHIPLPVSGQEKRDETMRDLAPEKDAFVAPKRHVSAPEDEHLD